HRRDRGPGRPDALRAAPRADKKDPIIYRPERAQVRPIPVGEAPAVGPVGVDDPYILLATELIALGAGRFDYRSKCKLPAVGAPGRADDGGVGGDGDFG